MINYSDLAYLYKKGSEYNAYKSFGAHFYNKDGINGVRFSVFAPNANTVYLVGDFNGWALTHKMQENLGIWDIFIPGIKEGHMYKYLVEDDLGNKIFKADPYGFSSELRPHSASIVADPFSYKFSAILRILSRNSRFVIVVSCCVITDCTPVTPLFLLLYSWWFLNIVTGQTMLGDHW